MTRPAKPSDGRPKFAVFAISVGWVAGMNGVKFRMLKTLKKLARIASLEPSPRNATLGIAKSLPTVRSTDVYPGPLKILRQRQPGPRSYVEFGCRIRENSIKPLLLAGIGDCAAKISSR